MALGCKFATMEPLEGSRPPSSSDPRAASGEQSLALWSHPTSRAKQAYDVEKVKCARLLAVTLALEPRTTERSHTGDAMHGRKPLGLCGRRCHAEDPPLLMLCRPSCSSVQTQPFLFLFIKEEFY